MHQKYENLIWMTAENPLQQIWMMIKSLRSLSVCKSMLEAKYAKNPQSEDVLISKAHGVSFLIQNACDYFEVATTNNLTQRLLNLYYGTLSFVEAEILVNSNAFKSLDDIEHITKQGHGLYSVSNEVKNVGEIGVGVLGQGRGLFPAWLDSRGKSIDKFPVKKANTISDSYVYVFKSLLSSIPELEQLMQGVEHDYVAGFFRPVYIMDPKVNPMFNQDTQKDGSYIALFDYSETTSIEDAKTLIGPLEKFEAYDNRDEIRAYKAWIRHSANEHWWEKVNTHKSAFCDSTIIKPLLPNIDDWEIYAVMILYCMSILVRYTPSIWRKIQHGEWDGYSAIFDQFAMVVERVIPNIFYEKITGNKLNIKMPGALGV